MYGPEDNTFSYASHFRIKDTMTDQKDIYDNYLSVGLAYEQTLLNSNCDCPLGVVTVENTNISLSSLRDILKRELPGLPAKFQFITETG